MHSANRHLCCIFQVIRNVEFLLVYFAKCTKNLCFMTIATAARQKLGSNVSLLNSALINEPKKTHRLQELRFIINHVTTEVHGDLAQF